MNPNSLPQELNIEVVTTFVPRADFKPLTFTQITELKPRATFADFEALMNCRDQLMSDRAAQMPFPPESYTTAIDELRRKISNMAHDAMG